MATTYQLISSVAVGSGNAAFIEFTSIPSTYTDLQLVYSARNSSTGDWISISFNASTSNFSNRKIFADGTSTYSYTGTNNDEVGVINGGSTTATTFGIGSIYIPNYRSSNNKSFSIDSVTENNATTAYMSILAGLWSDSSAITSIRITAASNPFVEHSTAYLYGISNA